MADNQPKIVITAEDRTRAAFASIQSSLTSLSATVSRFGSLGTVIAGALSPAVFVGFIKGAIDANAALDDMAKTTGATVESLSALADVARIGGHDLAAVQPMMVRLANALADAEKESSPAANALKALGLNAAELRNMELGRAVLTVAKALNGFADSGGKAALVVDLLGRSGAQYLPFLKDLAERGELHAKVTAEQAAEAEKLQKQWGQLKVFADDLGRSLASFVVPALIRLTENFNAARKAGYGFFQVLTGFGVRGLNETVGEAFENSAQRVGELNKELARLNKNRDFLIRRGLPTRDVDEDIAAVERRIKYYEALRESTKQDETEQPKKDISQYTSVTSNADSIKSQRVRIAKEAFDAELAAMKAGLKNAEDLIDASLSARLVSEENYWQAKGAMMLQALDLERRELENKIAEQQRILDTRGIDATQAQNAKDKIAELRVALDALAGKRTVVEVKVQANIEQARREIEEIKAKLRASIAEATGDMTPEMRRAAIERSFRDTLAKMGEDAEGQALIRRAIDVEAAKAEMSALESTWRLALETMRNAEQSVNIQREQGLITTADAQAKIAEAHRQAAAELDALLPKLEAVAGTLGPEAAARVAAFRNELAQVKDVADPVAASLNTSIKSAFEDMFVAIGQGAKSAKDAFADFARSVLGAIQRILAQRFAEQLFGSFGKGSGGIGDFIVGALGKIGLKFASGGPVPGSGTGDTVPAMLTPGEYVIRRDAVQRFGVAFLDAINGMRMPPGIRAGRLAFAAGGLVPQVGGTVNNVSVVVNAEGGGRVNADPSQAAELGRRIEAAVRGVLISEKRPGGLLAGA